MVKDREILSTEEQLGLSKEQIQQLKEWNDYRTRVSQWELDEYLYKF